MRAVSDLHFHIGDTVHRFAPKAALASDLPYLMLLLMALTQPRSAFDVEGYLTKHDLWYCFPEVD
jgi:hypothetical protein